MANEDKAARYAAHEPRRPWKEGEDESTRGGFQHISEAAMTVVLGVALKLTNSPPTSIGDHIDSVENPVETYDDNWG